MQLIMLAILAVGSYYVLPVVFQIIISIIMALMPLMEIVLFVFLIWLIIQLLKPKEKK